MVNVHIHQFTPGGALVDAQAMEQFQKAWAGYQKLVDSDVLSHKAAGDVLHNALMAIPKPFTFVDIACGDASLTRRALQGTKVSHYHGIDLSQPAIELAAKTLDGAAYAVDVDHEDFVTALEQRPEPANVAWCGLSIHHLVTDEKLKLLKAIRAATSDFLMIYEPSRDDGETRDGWLRRFLAVSKPRWSTLTTDEWDSIENHIVTCDLPETASGWLELGREAGFSEATQLFDDPTDGLRIFRYDV